MTRVLGAFQNPFESVDKWVAADLPPLGVLVFHFRILADVHILWCLGARVKLE